MLTPIFKQGDSVYSDVSPEEIALSDARISAAINDRSIHDVMQQASQRFNEIGEAVIVSARK